MYYVIAQKETIFSGIKYEVRSTNSLPNAKYIAKTFIQRGFSVKIAQDIQAQIYL